MNPAFSHVHTPGNVSDHRKLAKVKRNYVNLSETQCCGCYVSGVNEMAGIRD